jgi:general secretion pathway protein O/leader peptidase (prepilin peptidase)/N-methyltransferase
MTELPVSLWLWLTALGLCIGSLLNVVVYRLPLMLQQAEKVSFNLWWPRSHCPHCQATLRWHDNIPLLGWLLQRGRCRHCHHYISRRYPLIELATLAITLISAALFPFGIPLLAALLLGWILLALTLIDYDHQLLPDSLTLPLLWLGLLYHVVEDSHFLPEAVMGAVAGYLILWLLYWGFRLLSGREALGYGDFKLLAALGAWLGWADLPVLLLTASACGIVITLLAKALRQRPLNAALPFGPLLALTGWGLFLLKTPLIGHYSI